MKKVYKEATSSSVLITQIDAKIPYGSGFKK